MKKTRREFLISGGKITLAASFASLFWACENEYSAEGNTHFHVSKLFSDNVILQRDQPIPVWGWASPGSPITLFFNNKKSTTKTSDSGKWSFVLPPIPTGGPYKMILISGDQKIEVSNILTGDVYLCSGQSNMEWVMKRVDGVAEEIAAATDEKIRHFKVPVSFDKSPVEKLSGGEWQICSPETLGDFTAAGYFFAKNIRQQYDVPIGLINTTKGGSNIKMWMRPQTLNLGTGEAARQALDHIEQEAAEKSVSEIKEKYGELPEKDLGLIGEEAVWAKPDLDDSAWITINLPTAWGYPDFLKWHGVMWFRKSFYLEKNISENTVVEFSLGKIDDADQTFLNGKKIGEGANDYKNPRLYKVDAKYLKNGKNVLTIRVEDFGEFGGIFGNPEQMFLKIGNHNIPLSGDWKIKIATFHFNYRLLHDHGKIPSVLYNAMIHPLLQFPIKAILWYQGESDVLHDKQVLYDYRHHFTSLIRDWREQWGMPDLPFIFAQLSNAHVPQKIPSDSNWARIRESQSAALQLNNTAQVINIDSGIHKNSMHPQNKPELGRRFALAVRHLVFGEKIISSGPVFSKMEKHGKTLRLFFEHSGSGLFLMSGNKVLELAIAGADRKFVWAESKLEGDKIIVWHDAIADPVAVRYAWADNPLKVNLYNKEGLPAAPFRTDDW